MGQLLRAHKCLGRRTRATDKHRWLGRTGGSSSRLRMTLWNWPNVRSSGTRYFVRSMDGTSDRVRRALVHTTPMRLGNWSRMRSASSRRRAAVHSASIC